MNSKEQKINKILHQWNPIEVPDNIATQEYSCYVNEICNLPPDEIVIYNYLKKLITEMGLNFDEKNIDHKNSTLSFAKLILVILMDNNND